ncbi:hypothetical protein CYY_003230 [Polysphondylium violaceum]|uniref:MACPF domain-containing protein n=1 Tax=Polysphondylium violaceum TaxID=133409 RepID=A0A8J4V8V8_9MYCE|nr:hypothetical protein CYY_003230 [Polysphondylium violaceum]
MGTVIKLFVLVTLFICLFTTALEAESTKFYLSSKSNCQVNCGGDLQNAFRSFKDAIETISRSQFSSDYPPILYVNEGDYFGNDNKEITIKINIEIISLRGSLNTVIDCQRAGYGFKILDSQSFSMSGFTVRECNAGRGAAFMISNQMTSFEDMVFTHNSAREGAAVYSTASILNVLNSFSYSNEGGPSFFIKGATANFDKVAFSLNEKDLYCEDSLIESKDSTLGSICTQCTILDVDSFENLCGGEKVNKHCNGDGVCQKWVENYSNCPNDCPLDIYSCHNDGICYPYVETQICPDCAVTENPGWKLNSHTGSIQKVSNPSLINSGSSWEFIQYPEVYNFLAKYPAVVSGTLSSTVKPTKDGYYYFKLETENLNSIVFVKGQVLFDNFFPEKIHKLIDERKILMQQNVWANIDVMFMSDNNQQRDFSLKWRHESETAYSQIPGYYKKNYYLYSCGDGICNELDPLSCLIDCHGNIEKACPGQSPPAKLQDYYTNIHDTIGTLLSNQYIFSLPGINYISHGIDITTHETLPTPLFDLSYCDNTSFSLVQDPRRGIVYSIPSGIYAQVAAKCTMDTTTKTYATAEALAKEKSDGYEVNVEASVDGSYLFVSMSAEASFSHSETKTTASEMQKKMDGSISVTELHCETSKIHLIETKFHPKFIQDISKAFVEGDQAKSDELMQNVMKKYGTIYYQSATLGGKLEVISIVSNSFTSRKSSNEVEKSTEVTASLQLSGSVFGASASAGIEGSVSLDSTNSESEQNDYETNSMRSTVKVYGGEPGSYGKDNDANAFNSWAKNVDIVPFPIDYKVGYISDIIPKSWFFKGTHSIKEAWERNELLLYKDYFKSKKSKHIDQIVLSTLKKDDTVYSIKFVGQSAGITQAFNLEIVNLDNVATTYTNLPSIPIGTGAKPLLILNKYNDYKGVKSLKFTDPNTQAVLQPSAEFSLYNLFTSRAYEFVYQTDKYIQKTPEEPNTMILEISGFKPTAPSSILTGPSGEDGDFSEEMPMPSDGTAKRVLATIHGTTGKNFVILRLQEETVYGTHESAYTGEPIKLEYKENIGKILGIDFSFIVDHGHDESIKRFTFSFESLIIKRFCPESAECIPKKTLNSQNYINAYQLFSDGYVIGYTYGKPTWFPINPISP